MAGSRRRVSSAEPQTELPDDRPGQRELKRLAEASKAQRQEWASDGAGAAQPHRVALIEIVYAIVDMRSRAQELRLGFLVYLLGMAFHEAIEQLQATDPLAYPSPPAR